jgi:hypothetical protein
MLQAEPNNTKIALTGVGYAVLVMFVVLMAALTMRVSFKRLDSMEKVSCNRSMAAYHGSVSGLPDRATQSLLLLRRCCCSLLPCGVWFRGCCQAQNPCPCSYARAVLNKWPWHLLVRRHVSRAPQLFFWSMIQEAARMQTVSERLSMAKAAAEAADTAKGEAIFQCEKSFVRSII